MHCMMFKINSLARICTVAALMCAASACATVEQYAAEFETRWATVTAKTITNQPSTSQSVVASTAANDVAAGSVNQPSLAVQKAKLDKLKPGDGCRAIYEVAPSVLNQDVQNVEAKLKLAACDYQTHDLVSARQRYQDVLALQTDPRAMKGLALTELKDGELTSALQLLKQANEKAKQSDWQIMNALGYAEDQLGHNAEAEAAYLAAATLAPARGAPMNNLGMHDLRLGRHDEAVKAFTIAPNREPDMKIAELNRRITYAVKGDFGRAFAGATEQERSAILNSAGAAAFAKGDIESARWMSSRALETSPVFYENAYANLERAQAGSSR
jgi:Flp pilus assembly protein TadD